MKCPKCGADNDKVIDTRPSDEGRAIRRRRVCIECEYRYSTTERAEVLGMKVIKKDGTRQDFSREKLMAGLASACSKRPVSNANLEKIVDEVENVLTIRETTRYRLMRSVRSLWKDLRSWIRSPM